MERKRIKGSSETVYDMVLADGLPLLYDAVNRGNCQRRKKEIDERQDYKLNGGAFAPPIPQRPQPLGYTAANCAYSISSLLWRTIRVARTKSLWLSAGNNDFSFRLREAALREVLLDQVCRQRQRPLVSLTRLPKTIHSSQNVPTRRMGPTILIQVRMFPKHRFV